MFELKLEESVEEKYFGEYLMEFSMHGRVGLRIYYVFIEWCLDDVFYVYPMSDLYPSIVTLESCVSMVRLG